MYQQPQPVNVDFEEDVDGVRFNWNKWPASRVELEKLVLTLGCLYTPLKEPQDSRYHVELQQEPVTCCRTTCKAVINPFCYPDLQSQQKGWICNFCNQRNQLPRQYQHVVNLQHIPELVRNTVDYVQLNQPVPHPPIFFYVIDSSIEEEEFESLKSSILSSLTLLPPNAKLGLVTFNKSVHLWELGNSKNLKSYAFCGSKDYKPKQLQEWLGISLASPESTTDSFSGAPVPSIQATSNPPTAYLNGHPANHYSTPPAPCVPPFQRAPFNNQYQNHYPQQTNNIPNINYTNPSIAQPYPSPTGMQPHMHSQAGSSYTPNPAYNRQGQPFAAPVARNDIDKFVKPVSQLENVVNVILQQVSLNAWPSVVGRRQLRAVGSALSFAISLLETSYPNSPARIMLFLGGPCTVGPGMVIDDDLKNTIRSHHDIDKDNVKYLKKASDFYQQLAQRASSNGHAIDILSSALDQTGLYEMKYCTNMTNGLMVMGDSFDSNLFKTSFQRIFTKNQKGNLCMAFNATLDIKTSRELKVSGAVGSCIGSTKKSPYIADKRDGIGGTSEWKFCSMLPTSTTAFYFVVQNTPAVTQAQQIPCGFVQFITNYNGSDGFKHVRVTTIRRYFGSDDYEFDQETAAVLLARMACFRSETNEGTGQEILRWLDKSLVRVCQKFGDYHPNSPESFRLKDNFSMLPQFLFNMRRSQFIQVFNNSPDETTFYRNSLMREDCSNSLLMIQPALVSYELHKVPRPVSLDTSSIQPDRILLMDTFFQIVIFHGDKIAAWRRQNYQDKDGYESFKLFLEAPINDATDLMVSRFPLPRYVVCDQGSSQARFVLSRVNPSVTHNTSMGYYGDPAMAPVLSDDVSYAVFEEHLRKLTVSSPA